MKDLLLPLVGALLLAACAQHRLVALRADPTGQPITANSSALGWVAKQKRTAAECPTNLLAEVRVHQNLLQALATVLTLGAWMPTKFEYRCAKVPSQPPGGFDEPGPSQ